MPAPFTGREAERRLVAALVERVRAGRPGVIVFVGAAGVGKSRLLREIGTPSGMRRWDVVGYEPEASVPLAATGTILRMIRTVASTAALPAVDEGSAELVRVFEAAFEALVAAGPALLVIDDLQWLDSSSAALVHYLVRGAVAGDVPLGVVVAARPGPESAPAIEALERLLADADALTIHDIGPLEEDDAIALLRAAAPALSAAEAARIWRGAGGSPYWLLAIAQASGGDPSTLLRERLDRLSTDAATLLGLLAIAARPTGASDAAALLEWPEARVSAAVRELQRTGLGTDTAAGLKAAHDLVREAVAVGLPEAIRREHHRRLAAGYEHAAGDDLQQLSAALGHRMAAGEPAIDLAVRVSTADRRRWLGRDGLESLIRVTDEADDDEPQLPMLRREVARLASELGISDVALDRWRPLVEAGLPEEQAEARLAAAWEAYRLGDPTELRELLRPPAGGWDPVQAVEVLALEASSLLWLEARSADGQALATSVLEAARRLARDIPQSADRTAVERAYRAALKVAFEAAMQAENWQGLPALAAEQVEATSRLAGRARIEALLYEVMALRFQGAARTRYLAAERCREALQLARRDVLPDLMIEAGHFLAQSLHALGRLEEAEAVSAESVELAERVGDFSKLRARPKSLLWEIRVSLGPWREALANFEAEGAKLDPHFRLAQYQTAASLTSRIQGRAAANRAAELVELSLADSETAGCTRCRREAQLVNAVTLARVDRPDDARRLLAAADDDSRPEPYVESARLWARALLQAPATHELEAVIARCRLSGHHLDALWATIDLGRVLAGVDAPRASHVLREAGREAESMGARTQAQVIDRLLRGLGQRTWRRTAASADPTTALTDREREVAELIANGATNVEIAATLFVSVKTVERHVSNLLAKYDARNRTELAQRWSSRPS
ncbi:MAG TPA: AAA family ATPase [Candidatus Limnocylindrales bacterium]|nr:AAA family ATPase [Candidatus Limnocylindrales bacterium]